MTNTDKWGCRAVAEILHGHGVSRAVLCPGTRDLPLVMAFAREKEINCETAVDERSAAFIALGQAVISGAPVAVVCTSGTALLNMAPAVAEAYYREIPLVVVSADRPKRWIDQADSQTIRQNGALSHIVKRGFNIVAEAATIQERWNVERIVNDAMLTALSGRRGPVHVNVEIDEPLNVEVESGNEVARIIRSAQADMSLAEEARKSYAERLLSSKKVLVLAGCDCPDHKLNHALKRLTNNKNVALVAEPLANIPGAITNVEASVGSLRGEEMETMRPDVLITFGGALVSGVVKKWLRENPPREHWHVTQGEWTVDTFMYLTDRIDMKPETFFREISGVMRRDRVYGGEMSDYGRRWHDISLSVQQRDEELIDHLPWCDIKAMQAIVEKLPESTNIQLSNGMTVRYYERLCHKTHRVDCNRGVSGIDGSTSTAVGAAMAYDGLTVLMTGDMSAQYDIGALASIAELDNQAKFKMVVFANGGGNIFKYINNTKSAAETDRYLYNRVDTRWSEIGTAYGMAVFEATDMDALDSGIDAWIAENARSAMLVVHTDADVNSESMTRIVKG